MLWHSYIATTGMLYPLTITQLVILGGDFLLASACALLSKIHSPKVWDVQVEIDDFRDIVILVLFILTEPRLLRLCRLPSVRGLSTTQLSPTQLARHLICRYDDGVNA